MLNKETSLNSCLKTCDIACSYVMWCAELCRNLQKFAEQ